MFHRIPGRYSRGGAGSGGGAPSNAQYLVGATSADLSQERVVTNTPTVTWDLSTPGQAKANAAINPASDTVAGVIEVADQADQEAASSITHAVTPGRQHFHPSAVKVWGRAGTSNNLLSGYNISSVTTGTGQATFNFSVTFSSDATPLASTRHNGALVFRVGTGATTTSATIVSYTSPGTQTNPSEYCLAMFGDL
jgi:hypothetical protein